MPGGTTLFCLHFLGGSARTWRDVAARLEPAVRVVALDLPGFGDAAASPGADVATMAALVARAIRATRADTWWIAGHSMGAKVALALARQAEDGATGEGLGGLAGLALVAGSPPAPEPMDEGDRAALMRWIDDPASRHAQARAYIAENVGAPLPADVEAGAVVDVLRANPVAWKAWLGGGSREDWRQRIGLLRVPSLILSGSEDANLGPATQRRLMAPHLAGPRHIDLDGAGHLLPIERPDEVARCLREAIDAA